MPDQNRLPGRFECSLVKAFPTPRRAAALGSRALQLDCSGSGKSSIRPEPEQSQNQKLTQIQIFFIWPSRNRALQRLPAQGHPWTRYASWLHLSSKICKP
jgi:hypothetical protein